MTIPGNNLRDNLFMTPATEVTYEQWWWQFIAEHEDWRFADSDALRKAAFKGGQESLRSQLRNLLRPFAALLQDHNCNGSDAQPIFQINDAVITLGDLRRAVAATEQKP